MWWYLLAVLTAVFYGLYLTSIKISSDSINQVVGAVILQVTAAAIGGFVLLVLKMSNVPLVVTPKGVAFAVYAGLFVGLAETTTFFVFSKGIPVSVGTPIIIGGSIVVASVIGIYFFHETFRSIDYLALAFVVTGAIILANR
ncbi:MAG: EamA family transporter [Candidatus Diapherotrites archaeon]|nr:EamA family transporter [Candidatus Diapherotrites archaeon]